MPEEKKGTKMGEWVLAGFFLALGGFLFEAVRFAGRKLAEPEDEEDEGLL